MKNNSFKILSKLLISLTFVVINIWFSPNISAQMINYEDLFEEIENLTNEQAYSRFFNYQRQNPHFANTYMQLANLSEKIFKNTDPLRENDLVQFWANNAILYYQLFPVYLQSNEVRRNRELYSNIPVEASGRRLNNEDVLDYVQERVEFCTNYKDSLMLIFEALETSKDHYNNCVRIFNNINDNYNNINEALLKTDTVFLNLLSDLEQEFYATTNKFSRYKDLIERHPIGNYKQEYQLRTIKTFRLDGITNSDFLLDTFQLWNYGEWVQQFKNTYENDILELRKEIEEIHDLFDDNLELLAEIDFLDPEKSLESFDELFFFRLGKYDNNSLIREVFNYFDVRQNYLMQTKNELNDPADSLSTLMNRKLRYYYRLALQLNNSKNELVNFYNSITPERVKRFNDYFKKYYGDEESLRSYYYNQNVFLDQSFNTSLDNLDKYFENEEHYRTLFGSAEKSKDMFIPLFPAEIAEDDSIKTGYVTRDVYYIQNVPAYVAGYMKDQNSSIPFVAKISDNMQIEWLKEIDINFNQSSIVNETAEKIYAYENGVVAIVTANVVVGEDDLFDHKNEAANNDEVLDEKTNKDEYEKDDEKELTNDHDTIFKNVLVHIDNTGNIIFKEIIDNKDYPVYLQYDEINQLSLMAFGKKDTLHNEVYNGITICQADSVGFLNWQVFINAKGNFVDMVRAENKYIAYMNFQHYDIKGDRRITGNQGNNWSFFITDVSFDGDILNTMPAIFSGSFFINRVFSISSDEINLLGHSGKPEDEKGRLKYFIVSAEGDMIFHNMQ